MVTVPRDGGRRCGSLIRVVEGRVVSVQGIGQPLTQTGSGWGGGAVAAERAAARAVRRFRQSPLSMAGLAIIVVLLLIAVVGPFFVPYPEGRDRGASMCARS